MEPELSFSSELVGYACATGKFIWGALNSAFGIAFVGALAGAFGGAIGAQRIIERTKRREELLRELRNTNAAIMVAFSTCNAVLAVKKQHVQPLYEQFKQDKEAAKQFLEQRAAGKIPPTIEHHFQADLKVFPAPEMPHDTLKDLVFEKISAYGRALALVSVLEQSIAGFKGAIANRELLVNRFARGTIPSNEFANYYFGMPLVSGNIHQEYPDLVEAIHSYTNDIAFFSALLCEDLVAHGRQVREALAKQSKKGVPDVSTPDFSGPRSKGLIPPETEYADWINAFKAPQVGNAKK